MFLLNMAQFIIKWDSYLFDILSITMTNLVLVCHAIEFDILNFSME